MKQKITAQVRGMDCASCAITIEKRLKKQPGVESCEVSYATEEARINYDPTVTNPKQLSKEIEPLGYSLVAEEHHGMDHSEHLGVAQSDEHKQQELQNRRSEVIVTLPITMVTFAAMLWEIASSQLGFAIKFPLEMDAYSKIMLVVASFVVFRYGQIFAQGIWTFARHRAANMDTLVGIGTFTAYAYSLLVFLFPDIAMQIGLPENMYFDVTIVVIGFILFGKFLEVRSKFRTGEAIRKLLNLQAKTAIVIHNGMEHEMPVEEIKIGDILLVKPGTKIAVDGEIIEGNTTIDESMVSGEPLPVDKQVGDKVIGGTVNMSGAFKFKATKVGSQTLLAQIIKMVKDAQSSRAPIQRLADQISEVFVPAVLVIALVALVFWLVIGPQFLAADQATSFAILSFVGVLIIACPCALGLATPTGIIVGVGKGAEQGILIKNAESLQKLHQVKMLLVDKTGTLTMGKPEVSDFYNTSELPDQEIRAILSSIEQLSEHPLAQAIVRFAGKSDLKVEQFKNTPGSGITASIKQESYLLGNQALMIQSGIDLTKAENYLAELTQQGKTPVFLSNNKSLLAVVFISDQIRPDVATSIKRLHQLGIKLAMITGDNKSTAKFIAEQLGIDEVQAEMLPEHKLDVVKSYQDKGLVVAMLGDGINDSPALAQADVGIAMGSGTDIAIEAADVTLLNGDFTKVVQAIRLSKITMRVIKQNLFWAFIYNIVGIPLAAGLFYPFLGVLLNPAFAGAAMALSSVSVVANSLRLKFIKL